MTYGAFGLVEVLGEANAVLVLDRMLKTAEVSYETQDTKCGGHALIFVSGSVSAVQAAVESIKEAPPCKVFQTAVISNPKVYPISSHLESSASMISPFVREVLCSSTMAPGCTRDRSLSKASS